MKPQEGLAAYLLAQHRRASHQPRPRAFAQPVYLARWERMLAAVRDSRASVELLEYLTTHLQRHRASLDYFVADGDRHYEEQQQWKQVVKWGAWLEWAKTCEEAFDWCI